MHEISRVPARDLSHARPNKTQPSRTHNAFARPLPRWHTLEAARQARFDVSTDQSDVQEIQVRPASIESQSQFRRTRPTNQPPNCERHTRQTHYLRSAILLFPSMARYLTGIQPSGILHIGNYFGVLRPAVELQNQGDAFYFIADYHALTTLQNPEELRRNVLGVALDFLACGLDPQKVCFFRCKSDVPYRQHELTWILAR